MMPYIIIGLITLLILIGLLVFFMARKSGKKQPVDYYTFFIMGIIWVPCGVAIGNWGLVGMGIVFMIMGLVHKDEWKKNHKGWKDFDSKEKKLKILILLVLGLVFLLGLVVFFYVRVIN